MLSLRDQYLIRPDVIFLNHGSFGATPRPVFESDQHWQLELEHQPVEFLQRRLPDLMLSVRDDLARYLGTRRGNLLLVTNVTVGCQVSGKISKIYERATRY